MKAPGIQMRSLRKDIESTDIVATKRAVLAAQKPGGGDYTNIQCTTAGNLKTAIEEFDASLPTGTNSIGKVKLWDGTDEAAIDSSGHVLTIPSALLSNVQDSQSNEVSVPKNSLGSVQTELVRPYMFDGTYWHRFRGTIANGLDVDVTRLPALPAGTNNIGDVDVVTMPNVTVGTALPAGTNNIGDVDVLTLPALAAGSATIGKVDLNPLGSCASGQTTVTTAGTAVVLKSSTAIKSVTIKALSTNTGLIYVGDSGVSSANGFELEAGDSISLDIDNTVDIYVDSSVSGEKVSFIYVI